MAGGGLDAMNEAPGAMVRAADKYSRGLGARNGGSADMRAPRRPGALDSGVGTRSGQPPVALPEGFVPLHEVKDLILRGRWSSLEDRMSPCYPARIVAAMQRRQSLGDRDAGIWLEMHAQACSGDAEAQRTFGRMCENGSHRVSADVQRAFFWYYRAGLQGDEEARRNAERLMHRSSRISPATMAEPQLIYAGQWQITAHLSDHLRSSSVFDLASDWSATGWLVDNSRVATSPSQKSCYRGGWAFDGIGQVLTVIFEAEGGDRRWRGATWQIEMLGVRPGAIFGRDRRMVGYTLEYVPQGTLSDPEV
jgi:TPR repeat protein